MNTTKVCTKCFKEKPISEYWKSSRAHGGYRQSCKQCVYRQNTEWRKSHPLRWVSYTAKYNELNKERVLEKARSKRKESSYKEQARIRRKLYSLRHPEKEKARSLVGREVKAGRLIKPHHCSVCAKESRIYAHHPDHSKPFDIVWCCMACHVILDKKPRPDLEPIQETKRQGKTRICPICSKEFYRPPSKESIKTCSMECGRKWQWGQSPTALPRLEEG